MSDGDKQPIEKLADEVIKDDVATNGTKPRPGKEPKPTSLLLRPGAKYAIPAAVVLAGLLALAVVAALGGFSGSSKQTVTPSTAARSTPPTPPPTAAGSTAIDSCLVGTWLSLPLEWKVSLPAQTSAGGADVIVTFKADGTETVDMSQETPHVVGASNTYRGMTVARITTKAGTATATLLRSTATVHTVYAAANPPINKTQKAPPFAFALGGNPANRRYAVTETTLRYEPTPLATLALRRISPPPPATACETSIPKS